MPNEMALISTFMALQIGLDHKFHGKCSKSACLRVSTV